MASSRRLPVSYNVKTYGAPNCGRDYTVLATWEAATTANLVSAAKGEVLECYVDVSSFNDYISLSGATTNASYFRVIKPATGHKHLGKPGSGVTFVCRTDTTIFGVTESYAQIQDIVATVTINSGNTRSAFSLSGNYEGTALIGCIAVNCLNSGIGVAYGFNLAPSTGYSMYVVNCLAHNGESYGFNLTPGISAYAYIYNCTVTNNLYGFYQKTGNVYAKNCCASSNTTLDWSGTFTKTTCTAEDALPIYKDGSDNDFHLMSLDTVCLDLGTDLSADANYAFNDDIDGETRSGTWDIGFDDYFPPDIPGIFHLTGGAPNYDPNTSFGGATGGIMSSIALNNLYTNVLIGDSDPKYRAISIRCVTIPRTSLLFWVPANTTSPGTDLMVWYEGKNLVSPIDHTGTGEEDATGLGTFVPLDGLIVREAACTAGGASSVTLDAACTLTSAQVVGYVLEMVSGRSRDQRRRITAYDTGTKIATVDSTWVTIPVSGARFRIERKYLVGNAAVNDDFRFWFKRTQESAMGTSLYDSATLAIQWWK